MRPGTQTAVVGGLAVAAAWFAAPLPVFGPVLWIVLLLAILSLQPQARFLLGSWQLGLAGLLIASSWLAALDHESAFRHSLLLLAALLLLALARLHPLTEAGVYWVCVAIAATALVAIWQATGGLAAAGLDLEILPPATREAAAARIDVGRSFGTAALPGHFAALLLLATPPLLAALGSGPLWRRGVAAAALGLVGCGVLLSRSLAASLVVVVILTVALARGMRRRAVVGVLLALLVLTAATLLWRTDIGSLEPVHLRWQNWQAAIQAWLSRPWLGVGLGGVGQALLPTPAGATNLTPYAHNSYLQVAAEFGLAGLPAVLLAVSWMAGTVHRGLFVDAPLTMAVLVVPLHNVVDFSFYAPEVALPWAVMAGTLAGRLHRLPDRPTPGWLLVPVLVGGALLSTLAWRGETAVAAALAGDPETRVAGLVEAAAWTPWTVTPLLTACHVATETPTGDGTLSNLEVLLGERDWVRPLSGAWAENRARLLQRLGRQGEALVWAREARRRLPWRHELVELERACLGR